MLKYNKIDIKQLMEVIYMREDTFNKKVDHLKLEKFVKDCNSIASKYNKNNIINTLPHHSNLMFKRGDLELIKVINIFANIYIYIK